MTTTTTTKADETRQLCDWLEEEASDFGTSVAYQFARWSRLEDREEVVRARNELFSRGYRYLQESAS